jgi:hypothetical protein
MNLNNFPLFLLLKTFSLVFVCFKNSVYFINNKVSNILRRIFVFEKKVKIKNLFLNFVLKIMFYS